MNTHAGFQKQDSPHIVVLGAGAIGGYIGGCLAVAGAHLSFLGRSKMQHIVKTHGYNLTDLYGRHAKLEPTEVQFTTDPSVLQKADCVLVTVKSRDTLAAADLLRTHANPNASIISFQNGIGNAEALANQLPHFQVISGMVPFNVVTLPNGHLHCGTEGQLCTESNALLSPLITLFEKAGLPLQQHAHFKEIQWGKLILNLNNAVNALSDLPLKEELSQRAYRQCLALLISETLTVLNLAGIHPAKVSKVSAKLLPYILRTPDFVFKRLAASMLQIDEKARSSMWEDLQNQRTTEVTALNGAVVDLAKSIGVSAPVNARMVTLVQQAEKGLLKALSGRALLQTLKQVPLTS